MSSDGRRLALLVGASRFADRRLTDLEKPAADVEALARVLRSPAIGRFDEVVTLVDSSAHEIRRGIARLYAGRRGGDLLLLYFSGHGLKDSRGRLYLAAGDTEPDLLSATAVPADFVTDEMDRSRCRRQVLILDCCYSGAFARGAKGSSGPAGTVEAFRGNGFGRVVLTATDAVQYAWEEDQTLAEVRTSVFTHYLVLGLESGAADADGDGRISLDELYDYVYEQVVSEVPSQTPERWVYNQQGEIFIALSSRARPTGGEPPPSLLPKSVTGSSPAASQAAGAWHTELASKSWSTRSLTAHLEWDQHVIEVKYYRARIWNNHVVKVDGETVAQSGHARAHQVRLSFPLSDGGHAKAATVEVSTRESRVIRLRLSVEGRVLYEE